MYLCNVQVAKRQEVWDLSLLDVMLYTCADVMLYTCASDQG